MSLLMSPSDINEDIEMIFKVEYGNQEDSATPRYRLDNEVELVAKLIANALNVEHAGPAYWHTTIHGGILSYVIPSNRIGIDVINTLAGLPRIRWVQLDAGDTTADPAQILVGIAFKE